MSYIGGLGQVEDLVTLAPHSNGILVIQGVLVRNGAIRAADGLISATSPTLAAVQQWATAHGLSATGLARTSSSGLTIPRPLFLALIQATATPSAPPTATTSPTADGKTPPSTALPDVALVPTGTPAWVPWAAGATVVALIAGYFASRRRR